MQIKENNRPPTLNYFLILHICLLVSECGGVFGVVMYSLEIVEKRDRHRHLSLVLTRQHAFFVYCVTVMLSTKGR